MNLNFRKLLEESPLEKQIRDYRLRKRLAEVCLLDTKRDGAQASVNLYNALSHLACVPELNIDLVKYDHLQYQCYDDDDTFDTEVCILVKSKIKELDIIISELISKKGVG